MNEPRRRRFPADHVGVLIAALLMLLVGWGGIYLLVISTTPRIGPRWVFFVLLQVAVTGTVLPLVRALNARFTPRAMPLPPAVVLVRQSVWIGLFTVICVWLQIPRALQLHVVLLVALVFIILEIILRGRELASERR
ncbi:MAG: hypothetical protein OXF44_07065 [Anaerolineaceae bacterium]|nr:hypothetical protein [Anaerolineaceae bacterium]